MFRLLSFAVCAVLFLEPASCFVAAPYKTPSHSKAPTALSMSQTEDNERKFAASVLTAAYLFANVLSVAPAFASPDDFGGSSQVVAARSGGRMGGRSSMGTRGSSPSYSKTSVSHTTIVQPSVVQSPVMVAPPVGYGYGYGPDPAAISMFISCSFQQNSQYLASIWVVSNATLLACSSILLGLSVGISAINGISREMREQSQEREIMRERAELEQSRVRQAELEARLRALEAAPRN